MGMRRTMVVLALLGVSASPALPQSKTTTSAAVPSAEPKLLLEVTGGIGSTVVDVDQWAGTTANDWGTMAYSATGRLFFLKLGARARLGAEVAYRYFFWYNYYPGTTTYPYEYEVSATQLSGVVRFPLGARASMDLGAGAYMFDGATDFGAHLALGYHVPLGQKLTLPIQVRADYVLEDPSLLPITLNLGLGFKL